MSSLGRQVKSTAACAATSAALVAAVTPPSLPAEGGAAVFVSWTTRLMPALARFATIGIPMVPSPMNPTVSFMRAPSGDFDKFLANDFESRHGGRRVVQPRGTAYNVVAMREYSYHVDREGRIFHDGTEIVDAATLRFFLLALQRAPDGRWLAVGQGEQNGFEPYDTPFVVQRLGLGVAEEGLRAVELHFAGDYREPLDPATLQHADAGLFF